MRAASADRRAAGLSRAAALPCFRRELATVAAFEVGDASIVTYRIASRSASSCWRSCKPVSSDHSESLSSAFPVSTHLEMRNANPVIPAA